MQIPENVHEGGNSAARRDGLLPPLAQLIFFEGGFRQTKCHVVESHEAIMWYAFGVAWLNSRGVGLL